MPLTPFHLGPSSWLGLLLFRIVDFPALLVASVIVDVEPFVVIVFNLNAPDHGLLHTFLGGSALAVATAGMLYSLRGWTRRAMGKLGMAQNSSFKKILWSSLLGVYLHVVLDAFTHADMKPFYPSGGNPLFGIFSNAQLYVFCTAGFFVGIVLYLLRRRLSA